MVLNVADGQHDHVFCFWEEQRRTDSRLRRCHGLRIIATSTLNFSLRESGCVMCTEIIMSWAVATTLVMRTNDLLWLVHGSNYQNTPVTIWKVSMINSLTLTEHMVSVLLQPYTQLIRASPLSEIVFYILMGLRPYSTHCLKVRRTSEYTHRWHWWLNIQHMYLHPKALDLSTWTLSPQQHQGI